VVNNVLTSSTFLFCVLFPDQAFYLKWILQACPQTFVPVLYIFFGSRFSNVNVGTLE